VNAARNLGMVFPVFLQQEEDLRRRGGNPLHHGCVDSALEKPAAFDLGPDLEGERRIIDLTLENIYSCADTLKLSLDNAGAIRTVARLESGGCRFVVRLPAAG
jgi:hypothetical protein